MKTRTKRIWAIAVCAAALLGWGVLYLANISRRLASEGVETGAVLTSSFTRRVQHGSGAGRHRSRAIRHEDVGYFSYAYDVGGESYEGEVRRSGPLVRARVGDSVRVRYLPDAPARHTLVRDGEGNVRFSWGPRPRQGQSRRAE